MQVWNLKAVFFEFQALVKENNQATAVAEGGTPCLIWLANHICLSAQCTLNRSPGEEEHGGGGDNFKVTLRETRWNVVCEAVERSAIGDFGGKTNEMHTAECHASQREASAGVVEIMPERRLPSSPAKSPG